MERRGRVVIVAQLHDHVVDMVFPPEILMAGRIRQFDPAIVERVFRRIAPAIFRDQRHQRQQRFGRPGPVWPVEDAPHRPGSNRRGAVAFALLVCGDHTAAPDRTPRCASGQQKPSIGMGHKICAHGILPLL